MTKKKKPEERLKMGRPTKFNYGIAARIMLLASEGKSDKEIAEKMGISEVTLNNWKGNYPDFFKSLKESKDIPDDLVEVSLFARAVGYSHPEEKIFCNKDGEITRVQTTKYYPPDPTAMIFWLKNRRPSQWRDKQEVDHTVYPKPLVIEYSDGTKKVLGHDRLEDKDDETNT